MLKKIIFVITLSLLSLSNIAYATNGDLTYTKLTTVDLNTFNEYRFKITEQYLELRSKYEINGVIDKKTSNNILDLAKNGYKYLPDNLLNKNLYTKLKTAISKGIKFPENDSSYSEISIQILAFLEDVDIDKITGKIDAYPDTGNAPLTVTFRGNVYDPSGTSIPSYNYIWWMDVGGKRKILSNSKGSTLNYTFREEGTFTVFLDVTSNHKNANGYTDVLPFRSRSNIKIKEKVASLILKVNSNTLRNKDELKFNPDEARFGLVFDATSSTPTGGSTFSSTKWDFGNGVKRDNKGGPEIERIVYSSEGEYTVKLTLRTNEGKSVEREFLINIHDPIATINTNLEEGFLGDKFTFSAQSGVNDDDLTYSWEIVNITDDNVIFRKSGKLFTYAFTKKGQYKLVLKVTEPSSNEPDIDTKIIYINSKAPVASFTSSVPYPNRPNNIFLDATKSYDPDFSDEGNLNFSWIIDGERVDLENPNYNGSIGYYTFDSIGDHSVVLEVEDPDGIIIQDTQKVAIRSILSVDFAIFPRVATREQVVLFDADSSEAKVYEWDFGDAQKIGGKEKTIKHKYEKSGIFKVKLKVIDKDDNVNSFTREVYIGESNRPYAFINLTTAGSSDISYKEGVCNGLGAYIINRVDSVTISGTESINITGNNSGLTYSWKLDNNKYYTSSSFSKKFDELGCFPIKLVIKSDNNGKTDTKNIWVKVENIKPILSSIDVSVQDDTTDPVIVNVSAVGGKDIDGVIQSYLWYYYTDIDSEPQDFRATRLPNTNFVLPKVTGNYYFVVVMKDNNEARVNSEEITGSKYFITLSGDNINTPLVDLSVNKTSAVIGEQLVFTAKVENILGQDITKKIEFSWDLDGDGFYEKGNNQSVVQYSFVNSGEFHSKVKAKYKGFSNTKSITVGISSILKPDFSYISIGNKFVFFDKTIGENNTLEWDLGDGTIINNKKYFIHEYKGNKTSHIVKLKAKEGVKSKTFEQKVIKNIKNYLKSRKGGLVVFTSPDIVGKEINLENKEPVYIYLGDSKGEIKNYIIDYDLGYDSDLNGGKDDDEDNKGDESYNNGDPIFIKLNNSKIQNVGVSIKDSQNKIIDNFDFVINKLFIEEEIDFGIIDFTGVSDSEKLKIEKLKDYIKNLPNEYKLKAMMYIQKLQEEWFDNREKTNVILEFEGFINEIPEIESDEIINILESLLVEGQEDQSSESITFNALRNLIPLNIKCPDDESNKIEDIIEEEEEEEEQVSKCYLSIIEKIELIRDSNNVEDNKILGGEILKIIEKDNLMENKQKIDFKAILKTLIYGGLDNIPEEEIVETEQNESSSSGDLFGLIGTILFWIAMIIGGFVLIIVLYYIYYLLVNKDKNIGFQDFIIDKTSGIKRDLGEEKVIPVDDFKDILGDLNDEKILEDQDVAGEVEKDNLDEEIKIETETKLDDVISYNDVEPSEDKHEVFDFADISKDKVVSELQEKENEDEDGDSQKDDKVPDWLKGSFGSEEIKNEEELISTTEEIKVKNKEEIKEGEKLVNDEEVELKDTEIKEDIGDLIGDEVDIIKEGDNEAKKEDSNLDEELSEEIIDNKYDKQEEKQEEKLEEEKIPDWLRGNFGKDDNNNKVDVIENTPEQVVVKEKTEIKEEVISKGKKEKNKEVVKNEKNKEKKHNSDIDSNLPTNEELEEITKIDDSEESNNIPEWLKGSFSADDKKEVTKVKENLVVVKEKPKKEEIEIKTKEEKKEKDTKNDNKSITNKKSEKSLNEDKKTQKGSNSDLWDDGMRIPDWLKTEDK